MLNSSKRRNFGMGPKEVPSISEWALPFVAGEPIEGEVDDADTPYAGAFDAYQHARKRKLEPYEVIW